MRGSPILLSVCRRKQHKRNGPRTVVSESLIWLGERCLLLYIVEISVLNGRNPALSPLTLP